MKVFKATRSDMTCTMGSGTFRYQLGVPAVADGSKCGSTGLHACEYVLDCTGYYGLGGGNRFFLAEAAGDIAEDGINTRIACTELTLVQELTSREIAAQAVLYMVKHPRREGWKKAGRLLDVKEDCAIAEEPGAIAIARGSRPLAKGPLESHLGLVREDGSGITDARILTVGRRGIKPDTWYTVRDGLPVEAGIAEGGRDETEAD